MFDIGFTELLVIAVIALLVLGPERLPGAITSGSRKLSQLKRSFNSLKEELAKEVNIEELRQDAHNSSIMKQLEEGGKELKEDLDEVRSSLTDLEYDINNTTIDDSDRSEKNSSDKSSQAN
ncbi:MAG: sec-independent protein translocase protein TatB [Pseudomonadales bacterium]|jgi:sec-independent protein translocase protein TatB